MVEQDLETYILPDKDTFYNWVYQDMRMCL